MEEEDKAINGEPSNVVDAVGEEDCEQKKEDPANTVSIDVTKALLLLGVNCWSNLEPGEGNVHDKFIVNQLKSF